VNGTPPLLRVARLLAEELGHHFVEIIPSELASPFIHGSVIKIRNLFDAAAERAPAVVFIDEFEALVPSRETLGGHQDYKSSEVNEFLTHLSSCSKKNIFIVAATNQPEKIDAAVRRTGRLDKLIYVGPPDEEARREMLALHLEGRPLARKLDYGALAKATEFYSASDLRFLVDEAARDALSKKQNINNESFLSAMTKIQPSVNAGGRISVSDYSTKHALVAPVSRRFSVARGNKPTSGYIDSIRARFHKPRDGSRPRTMPWWN
jgi:transitional endoplasmic reticulum ATPase